MRLKAFRHIGDREPIITDVSVVVIEGEQGQPVVVAADLGQGSIEAEVLKPTTEVEFNRILQSLGINRLVIAEDLGQHMLPMSQHRKLPHLFGRT